MSEARGKAGGTSEAEGIARELEDFVRERFLVPDDDPLFSREVNLWDEGYVDSPGVVEVLAWLEERYALTLPEDVVFRPEFTSIRGMAETLAALLAGDGR